MKLLDKAINDVIMSKSLNRDVIVSPDNDELALPSCKRGKACGINERYILGGAYSSALSVLFTGMLREGHIPKALYTL